MLGVQGVKEEAPTKAKVTRSSCCSAAVRRQRWRPWPSGPRRLLVGVASLSVSGEGFLTFVRVESRPRSSPCCPGGCPAVSSAAQEAQGLNINL